MRGYLGLGSNEGDRRAALEAAQRLLPAHGVEVVRASSVYETAPQGEVRDQPDFLNACLEIETDLGPVGLLAACKEVERDLGRPVAGRRHGPRPIDVDVLLLGELEQRSPAPMLPHPELTARRFVLEPLLELEPHLRLPDGTALAPLLERVRDQPVRQIQPASPRRPPTN